MFATDSIITRQFILLMIGSLEVTHKLVFTFALKPRGDVSRSPKQGYQWPHTNNFFKQIIFVWMQNPYFCSMYLIFWLHPQTQTNVPRQAIVGRRLMVTRVWTQTVDLNVNVPVDLSWTARLGSVWVRVTSHYTAICAVSIVFNRWFFAINLLKFPKLVIVFGQWNCEF